MMPDSSAMPCHFTIIFQAFPYKNMQEMNIKRDISQSSIKFVHNYDKM